MGDSRLSLREKPLCGVPFPAALLPLAREV